MAIGIHLGWMNIKEAVKSVKPALLSREWYKIWPKILPGSNEKGSIW